MKLCIVEDQGFEKLYPLTKTRPSFGLRCGRFTLAERILKVLKPHIEIESVHYIMRPELEGVWSLKDHEGIHFDFKLPEEGDRLILHGRVLFSEELLLEIIEKTDQKKPFAWKDGEPWIAIYLPDQAPQFSAEELKNRTADLSVIKDQAYMDQAIINWPWDLIRYNSVMIGKDFLFLKKHLNRLRYPPLPEMTAVLRGQNLMIGRFAEIHPFVTFDCTEGPVIIGDNVNLEAGTYIKGPVSIGDDCLVSAHTKLYNNSTLGNTCKAGGEISHSIMHGFSNKRHSGFLGNSYLGEWVNIGAGSNNSNLKNNYNTITVRLNGKIIDTNTQFVGLFMGDHSRCAIGTRFNTATFVGVGCNIFGNGLTPKVIDDFSWGGINQSDIFDFKKFIENAHRMMIRREIELSSEEVELLGRLYQSRLMPEEQEDLVMNQETKIGI
jgi:UDP-N-acetylglucosamine diphosphorylase / glucose-1-phosphate thymidylyltransferase / UDP-N-acetylgalactosamine diphosphorylase / glucosamine-1-phosphate N-acetyltransferase / galactosamine-1-phosphate N-acetyltransferase